MSTRAERPRVSVVIPTRNAGRTIGPALDSLASQSFSDFETIVVDALSDDETVAIAESKGAQVIALDSERTRARNAGAAASRGAFLLFVDSDMRLTPRVIEACVASAHDADTLVIPEIVDGQGFLARCRRLEKACYDGDDEIEAARFFRREWFEKIGGYDVELTSGEDWDLATRAAQAGARVGRIREPILHDEGVVTLAGTARKKFYYGRSIDLYRDRHPARARRQFSLIRPAFTRNWRLLVRDPLHALGLIGLKALDYASGGLGIVASRFADRRGGRSHP